MSASNDLYDVVVIGGGAAGLNAALVLARARRRVVVVDAGEPRNAPAAHMHGFLSRDGMPPKELLEAGRAEVAGYGGEFVADGVVSVTPGFSVALSSGRVLSTRRILVATGLRDRLPDIPGLRERWGDDVMQCPYCHGYEVRDQAVGVIAVTPESATHHAQLVRQWAADLTLFTNDVDVPAEERERLAARGIKVVDGKVARVVVEDDRVRGVELADGAAVPRDALFVGGDWEPRDALLRSLGCEVADGWVRVDGQGRTSVPGVSAAGNVVDQKATVIAAAAQGAMAAIAINGDLVAEDVERAARERRVYGM
ncbi:NAD(P)/FAD-dependent oxidoreductase [Phytomonospora endophytica]|uniref:Thioredoxin reductase n=1 Tax=Phytomonospora endophytica TaxID=714109 RepID=A0A841FP87_9ACTN|nr:NAD(P)/FAD-dependent oxidoreductase [Phytomonospora endophytica]MBB6035372.1 thioredoxin reductase [Phytomonospora endophytica]GIG63876.1 thioredoxin reductase [Phytomonospora endophytica]